MILLTNEQKVKLTLAPKTQLGNPASLDGIPVWNTSDSNVATLDVSPDGLSAYVISNNPGVSQISAICDGDLGDGVRELSSAVDVQVVLAEAFSVGFTNGEVELK